jgi:hypothetical protein
MSSLARRCYAANSDEHCDVIFGPSLLSQSLSGDGKAGDITEASR